MYESVSRSDGGRLSHTEGPASKNPLSQSSVRIRTVVATLVVADRRRLLLESMLATCRPAIADIRLTVLVEYTVYRNCDFEKVIRQRAGSQ